MIAALTLMCALHSGACLTTAAHRIAWAIDMATDSDALRAQLVVAAWEEGRFREHPAPDAWDSRIGLAVGPWQEWGATQDTPLVTQARRWLWMVARGGYPALCGFGQAAKRMAFSRAMQAERLLQRAAIGSQD